MEFPDLGKKCTVESCNRLDFLPYNCVHCHDTFCQDHFKLEDHNCSTLKDPKYDIRVPSCPVCEKPVPLKRGEDPNIRMDKHILSNCSDLPTKNSLICNKKHCNTKLLVPVHCSDCKLSYCFKHRFAVDHQCHPSLKPKSRLLTSMKEQNIPRSQIGMKQPIKV